MTDVNSAGVAVPVDWRALLLVRGERWVESQTGLLAAVEYRSLWSLGDRRLAIEITVHPRSASPAAVDRARVRLFSGTRWHTIVRLPADLLDVSVAHADLGHFRWQEGRLLWDALVVLGADPGELPPETRLSWLLYASEPGDPPVDPADPLVPLGVPLTVARTVPPEPPPRSPTNGDRPAASRAAQPGGDGSVSVPSVRHARPIRASGAATHPGPAADAPPARTPSRLRPPVPVPVEPGPAVGSGHGARDAGRRPPEPDRASRRPGPAQPVARSEAPADSVPAPRDVERLPWQRTGPTSGPHDRDAVDLEADSEQRASSPIDAIGDVLGRARERVAETLDRLEVQREATQSIGQETGGGRPGPLWGPEVKDGGAWDRYGDGQDDRRV